MDGVLGRKPGEIPVPSKSNADNNQATTSDTSRAASLAQIHRSLRAWRNKEAPELAPEEEKKSAADNASADATQLSRKVFLADDGTPGNNQAQNRQFEQALQEIARRIGRRVSRDERQTLHQRISHQNMGYEQIVEEGVGLFGGAGGGNWRDQRRDRNRGR